MGRPIQDVRIFDVQDRRRSVRNRKPWVVRRRVDGRERSTAFATRALADRYRAQLMVAQQSGERFDPATGEPTSWGPAPGDVQLHVWVRQWLSDEWNELQPKTRNSYVEALARFVPLVCHPAAAVPPESLRPYLFTALRPGFTADPVDPHEQWMARWSSPLNELTRELLARVERDLTSRLDGKGPLGPATAGRYRKTCRACIRRAVDLEVIPSDPWPPAPRGRRRRKVARKAEPVDVRRLPGPDAMPACWKQWSRTSRVAGCTG